jgi:hypothetical protein
LLVKPIPPRCVSLQRLGRQAQTLRRKPTPQKI